MGRLASLLRGSVLARAGVVALMALVAVAIASSGPAGGQRDKGQRPAGEPVEVIDLNEVAVTPAPDRAERPAKKRRAARPSEEVSEAELGSVESKIRARSSDGAAAPNDGVSPGAPSDEQVRAELRGLRRAQRAGPTGPIKPGAGNLTRPVDGQFTSPFGQRWGRLHAGIDLSAPTGTPIRAAAAGQVILMSPTGGYGNYTCIHHGRSVSTCYAHQSRFRTARGAVVEQGEVVGYVGNTGRSFGPHLHFEVRVDGRPVDPVDYF